jgi:predicted ATPase
MLKRLYIDNYKCFVNFELRPARSTLLAGLNGAGKSAAFELLEALRGFWFGELTVQEAFPPSSLTRWQTFVKQKIEIEVERRQEGAEDSLLYTLEIEQDPAKGQCRVLREEVEGTKLGHTGLLWSYSEGEMHVCHDDLSAGPTFPLPSGWSNSVMMLLPSEENARVSWLREWMRNLFVVRLDPRAMTARTENEAVHPRADLSDFASWFRRALLEKPIEANQLFSTLGRVWDGFKGLELVQHGETVRTLKVRTAAVGNGSKELRFGFEELSDGQRALIGLYSLLHLTQDQATTLLLDEPDNFVALAEIQPLISELCDRSEEGALQVVFASHHPEIIDHPAIESRLLLRRENGGATRVRELEEHVTQGLTTSETIARGWE